MKSLQYKATKQIKVKRKCNFFEKLGFLKFDIWSPSPISYLYFRHVVLTAGGQQTYGPLLSCLLRIVIKLLTLASSVTRGHCINNARASDSTVVDRLCALHSR
ncbi:hypothetical protein L596_005717 [Steinernema carpocapsae]|uniref:Uncharacterized protein n=1 Tax=Steinernema carpocapsae TaxID=34508 RepID=A0A4U8V1C8_STECR|nr:hypothetical protein L596_005717 [Steinernema carpocapsae]